MDAQSVDALLSQCLSLFNARKYAEAADGLKQVVAAQPGNVKACTLLGACLGQTGHHSEAVEQFLELTRLDHGNPLHYFNLGNAYRSCGKIAQAEGAYRKAIEINPGYQKATDALGSLTVLKNQLTSTQASPQPIPPIPQPAPPASPAPPPWQNQPQPPAAPQYAGGAYAGQPQVAPLPPVYSNANFVPFPPGLNWGAFLIPLWWSIAHNTWVGLLTLVPPFTVVIPFALLFKGNEWGMQNRAFSSVDEFLQVQRMWLYWGLVVNAPFILLCLLLVFGRPPV